MKRVRAIGFALLLLASVARGAEFDVGRATLSLSEDTWESIGENRKAAPYTGDRSGELPTVTRYLLLRDSGGKFQAALAARASGGVGSVRMTWAPSCKPQQNVHVVDNANGNLNRRDCLVVTKLVPLQRFLELAAPDLLSELVARGVALPRSGYAIADEVGLENGTYLAIQTVFAGNVTLPVEGTGAAGAPEGISPEAVAWGNRLADAVRRAAYSLSARVVIPPTRPPTPRS